MKNFLILVLLITYVPLNIFCADGAAQPDSARAAQPNEDDGGLVFNFLRQPASPPTPIAHPQPPKDPRDVLSGVPASRFDLDDYKSREKRYKSIPKQQLLLLVGGDLMHLFINRRNQRELWCTLDGTTFRVAALKEGKFSSLEHEFGKDGIENGIAVTSVCNGSSYVLTSDAGTFNVERVDEILWSAKCKATNNRVSIQDILDFSNQKKSVLKRRKATSALPAFEPSTVADDFPSLNPHDSLVASTHKSPVKNSLWKLCVFFFVALFIQEQS